MSLKIKWENLFFCFISSLGIGNPNFAGRTSRPLYIEIVYPGFGFSPGSSTVGNQLTPVRLACRLDRILGEIGDTGGTAGCKMNPFPITSNAKWCASDEWEIPLVASVPLSRWSKPKDSIQRGPSLSCWTLQRRNLGIQVCSINNENIKKTYNSGDGLDSPSRPSSPSMPYRDAPNCVFLQLSFCILWPRKKGYIFVVYTLITPCSRGIGTTRSMQFKLYPLQSNTHTRLFCQKSWCMRSYRGKQCSWAA